jgi:hypothetical protein
MGDAARSAAIMIITERKFLEAMILALLFPSEVIQNPP